MQFNVSCTCRNVFTVKCYISIYISSTNKLLLVLRFTILKLEAWFLDVGIAIVIRKVPIERNDRWYE